MRRLLLKTIAGVILLAAMVTSGGYVYLRRSLPQIDSTTTLAGLSAPIDIIRDADAIPHIFANTRSHSCTAGADSAAIFSLYRSANSASNGFERSRRVSTKCSVH